jgi:hypothetical protein
MTSLYPLFPVDMPFFLHEFLGVDMFQRSLASCTRRHLCEEEDFRLRILDTWSSDGEVRLKWYNKNECGILWNRFHVPCGQYVVWSSCIFFPDETQLLQVRMRMLPRPLRLEDGLISPRQWAFHGGFSNKSVPVWWFGTWIWFSPIAGMIIQSDELIFFRGVGQPPTRFLLLQAWFRASWKHSLSFFVWLFGFIACLSLELADAAWYLCDVAGPLWLSTSHHGILRLRCGG